MHEDESSSDRPHRSYIFDRCREFFSLICLCDTRDGESDCDSGKKMFESFWYRFDQLLEDALGIFHILRLQREVSSLESIDEFCGFQAMLDIG